MSTYNIIDDNTIEYEGTTYKKITKTVSNNTCLNRQDTCNSQNNMKTYFEGLKNITGHTDSTPMSNWATYPIIDKEKPIKDEENPFFKTDKNYIINYITDFARFSDPVFLGKFLGLKMCKTPTGWANTDDICPTFEKSDPENINYIYNDKYPWSVYWYQFDYYEEIDNPNKISNNIGGRRRKTNKNKKGGNKNKKQTNKRNRKNKRRTTKRGRR